MSNGPSLPIARIPSVLAASAVEEEMERLEFRGPAGQDTGPALKPVTTERTAPEAKHNSRVDEQFRVGKVMKALFPEGIQIGNEEQFATMRLFNALVASIAQFAQSNMSNPIHIRDVKKQAEMLDEMVGRIKKG
jgi:hypothetical protein